MRPAAIPGARALSLCAALLLGLPSTASSQAARAAAQLGLSRVRLYETGVGYFERRGRVGRGTQLRLPTSHLDDALKTLVVLDTPGEGSVRGLSFETLVSEQLGRALARVSTGDGEGVHFETLARSLAGSEVVVRARGREVRGRLLQVVAPEDSGLERCLPAMDAGARKDAAAQPAHPSCVLRKQSALLLLSDRDALMRFAIGEVEALQAVRPSDAARLRAAFGSGAEGSRSERSLQVEGALSSAVTLGYVAEAPLWRTSYRLVLGADGSALLQAWALLHNDTEEDWHGVQVELVNGQPDSFLFPLAAPRYARRRLVTPEHELSSVPQLLERGADALWDRGEVLAALRAVGHGFGRGLGLVGTGRGGGGTGEGTLGQSSLLQVGDLASHADAAGEEIGALFRYAVQHPVDLRAHGSLLVPILKKAVAAERVSYFAPGEETAQSALILENSTRQTLPAGTVAIFEGGGFGGESAIDRLKPKQKRVLPFGVDLDVEVESLESHRQSRRRSVDFFGGRLREHYLQTERRALELRNRSAAKRTVHLGLEVVNNARVERADRLFVGGDGSERRVSAVYLVEPESTRRVELEVEEGLVRRTALAKLKASALWALASDPNLRPQREILLAAHAELKARERIVARQRRLGTEIGQLQGELKRARGSLKVIARADREVAAELSAELLRLQRRLSKLERTRQRLDPDAPLRAARAALRRLMAS